MTEFIRQFSIFSVTVDDSFANSATTDTGQHFSNLLQFIHCFFSLYEWLACFFVCLFVFLTSLTVSHLLSLPHPEINATCFMFFIRQNLISKYSFLYQSEIREGGPYKNIKKRHNLKRSDLHEVIEAEEVKVWHQTSEDQRKSLLNHLKHSHRRTNQSLQANNAIRQSCSVTKVRPQRVSLWRELDLFVAW